MRKIVLKCEKAELILELRETLTADIIYNSLPLKSKIQKWGEEIFLPNTVVDISTFSTAFKTFGTSETESKLSVFLL